MALSARAFSGRLVRAQQLEWPLTRRYEFLRGNAGINLHAVAQGGRGDCRPDHKRENLPDTGIKGIHPPHHSLPNAASSVR
jgi:hypothetical protein